MPGVRGPSEYSQEPSRDPSLKVNAKEPFNAEPPRSALVSSYVTPVHLFYKRNHGPIPIVDHIENYSVSFTGLIDNQTKLSLKDIRSLPKYNVTATLQCAGNRRTAMSKVRNVRGVGWDVSAIGNAVWGGAKLADVLELLGIPKLTSSTVLGGRHVEFVSVDRCKEENGGPYKASIPLSQATNPDADVLLAYEMNGEILNRDHGFPLRVVVPGVIGARSVKWLDSINLLAEECQGFFMQKDYKMFPPSVNWDNINWSSRRPQMDFPVQSAICSLEDVQMVKPGKVSIKGYAVSGGGRGIEREHPKYQTIYLLSKTHQIRKYKPSNMSTMKNNNNKKNMKMSSGQESGNGTTNIVVTETKNKKVERKTSMDVDQCAEAFIANFRKQLLLQRLESIDNMLSRGL
ncbi:unnamed protein product [Brassica rapa subsp. trilocularis]